jgi:acetolactate synthase-1/2/3 large subunit
MTGSRWPRPGSWPTPGRRCGAEDIVLVDTGALKMWMARLYPTYEPNTCLISNGLSTMAWTVPGAIGAKIARPDCRVLVATGDGAFLMNSQEIETALRRAAWRSSS